jgi:hypothetical protein
MTRRSEDCQWDMPLLVGDHPEARWAVGEKEQGSLELSPMGEHTTRAEGRAIAAALPQGYLILGW